jgi:hypothetical protein
MLRAMKTGLSFWFVSLVLAMSALGCAYGEARQVIRAQFASEIGCDAVKLTKRSTWYAEDNPNQFKVSGCGVVRTYTCEGTSLNELVSYDEPACTWVEGDADAPKTKAQAPTEGGENEAMDAPMDAPMEQEPAADDAANDDSDGDSNGDSNGKD